MFLSTYVPYDPSVWSQFWSSSMRTISSAVSVGFLVFGAIFCIGLLRAVIRMFL